MMETDEVVRDLLDRLEPSRVERPEWDDVLARLERPDTLEAPRPGDPGHSPGTSRWRNRTARGVLVGGVVAAAAAIALTVTAPWRGGPTILERASAAIHSPSPTEVLYMSFETKRAGCCRLLGHGTPASGCTDRHHATSAQSSPAWADRSARGAAR